MKQHDTYTIPEIAILLNKTTNTCYRYVREKKLNVITVLKHGKNIATVEKSELERFCRDNDITVLQQNNNKVETTVTPGVTPENIQNIVKDTIDKTITQLAKPMEEQALYIAGKLSTENQFLKERLETVLKENELLREQVKALPGPTELETKENTIILLQEELKNQEDKLKKEQDSTQQILLENAQNLTLLQKEKEELTKKMEEYTSLPSRLKEVARKLHDKEQEMAALEATLKKEKDEIELRLLRDKEAMKAEAEEAKKQKEELESRMKAQAEAERVELETRLKAEAESERKKLLEEAEEEKAKLKSEAEEREKQIAEAWKKELELARKPWWKFW